MALTLVTTPKSASANSYASVAEANSYFEKRLHKSTWEDADDEDKKIALIWATQLLDEKVQWDGIQSDSNGALRFPRIGLYTQDGNEIDSDTIPQFLKNATAEFAMHLIAEDRTAEANRDLKGFKSITADVIQVKVDTNSMNSQKPTMPPSVWSIIKFYGILYGKHRTLVRG